MPTIDRRDIPCAICGPGVAYRVRHAERIDGAVNFAARKMPTQQHFRIVECERCGLVYSNPILPAGTIEKLYRDSPFIDEGQLANMAKDYAEQVQAVLPLLPGRHRLLEIGCANGFFLKEARRLGFDEVYGVEPGAEAVQRADPDIRARIVHAPFAAALFPRHSFDIICCFQVLDHLLDPVAVLRSVHELLRDDGVVLMVHHNIRSWLPRLLGRRCPMFDIEHIYLFDRDTAALLLQRNGFQPIALRNCANAYSIDYALKMFPLPGLLKRTALGLSQRLGLEGWRIRLPAGNMVSVGRKCAAASVPATVPRRLAHASLT